MKNWKIGTRIGAGFAAVIAIAMTLGIFAYSKVGGIEKDSKEAAAKALPKVYLVGQVQNNVEVAFSLGLQNAISSDRHERAELETEIQALRSTNAGIIGEYEKLISTEKGRALHEAFKTGEARQVRVSPGRRATQTRSAAAVPRPADPRSTTAALSQMHHAVKAGGSGIELDTDISGGDSHDREFTTYQA
jgi:hypothetical protein